MLLLTALPPPLLSFVATATVRDIHDGDTLTVDIDLGYHVAAYRVPIRLHGFDAREITGPGKFGGLSDREALLSLLPLGSSVIIQSLRTLRSHEARTFARYVCRVWLGSTDINAAMAARIEALGAPTA
jgi:endonuclease YncB( thermonuclease family)